MHIWFLRNYCRYATHVRRVDHSSDPTTTPSTSSGSSSPASSNKATKKRVQFSQEVKDNELTSSRLIYDKLPMASPPRRAPVVIDITKLNAEQGFGFNKYLTTDSNGDYRQQIFESPYFDYRRTHSKVSFGFNIFGYFLRFLDISVRRKRLQWIGFIRLQLRTEERTGQSEPSHHIPGFLPSQTRQFSIILERIRYFSIGHFSISRGNLFNFIFCVPLQLAVNYFGISTIN